MNPYKECDECLAKVFCKKRSGQVVVPESPSWCISKFRLDKAIDLSNIPRKYRQATIYSFRTDEHNLKFFNELQLLIKYLNGAVDKGVNFFFHSNFPGTGKTFSACVLLNHYIYSNCLGDNFDFESPLAYFVSFPELIHKLRYERGEELIQKEVEFIKTTPLVLLDDIGAGTASEYAREQAYLLINARSNEGLPTIATSNFKLSELASPERLGARFVSRLKENCRQFEFTGTDRRAKR